MINWTIWGSIIIATVGIIWFISGFVNTSKRKKKRKISPLNGLILSIVIAFFLIFINRNQSESVNILDSILTSILNTLRVFSGESGLNDTREALGIVPSNLKNLLWTYTAIIHTIVPVILAGVLVSVVRGFLPKVRYKFNNKRVLFIFSEITEKTVLLAEDIKQNCEKTNLIIFCDNYEETDEKVLEWKERIEIISGLCIKKDISMMKFNPKSEKEIHLFLLENKEENNLKLAIELSEVYKNINKIKIHLAASMVEAEDMIDSIDKGNNKIKLRLINESKAIVYSLFDEMPLFCAINNNKLKVMIVGCGNIGFEALKTICWCGQFDNVELEVIVVDINKDTQNRILANCPEFERFIKTSNKNKDLNIEILCMDANNKEFFDMLKQNNDIGYVVCCLGDENINLHIGAKIRSTCESFKQSINKQNIKLPIINILIQNQFMNYLSENFSNAQNQKYNLNAFGSIKKIYTWRMIVGTYLDQMALGVHRIYDDGNITKAMENFENSEYNKKNSMVAAVHCKYKLFQALSIVDNELLTKIEWENQIDDNLITNYINNIYKNDIYGNKTNIINKLSELEHRRWMMYMFSEGFQVALKDEAKNYYQEFKDHKNLLAKKHPGLVSWDELDNVSRFISEIKGKKVDLKETNKKMVISVPQILWQNRTSEKSAKIRARLMINNHLPAGNIEFDESGMAKNNINALIVGFGVNGQCVLKELIMNGSFLKDKLSIVIMDENIKDKYKKFFIKHKGLFKEYKINFYEMKNVNSCLKKIKRKRSNKFNYIAMCMDSEFDNDYILPYIKKADIGEKDNFYFLNEFLSEKELINYVEIKENAKIINHNYNNQKGLIEESWKNIDELSRESSLAAANFAKSYKLIFKSNYQKIIEDKELFEKISQMEHLRWCGFHYAMGFSKMTLSELENRVKNNIKPYHKDLINKKHACLIDWEELDVLSKKIEQLTGNQYNFKEMDRENIRSMINILN